MPNGNAVKVSAVDPVSLREVSIVGPASASRMELQMAAVRKLEYVLNREAEKSSAETQTPPRRGIIV
ncbi:hypothetical protein GCM10007924_16860 [Sneathiella chinensis]|uniref:DUF6898 domain-containing protein n=1 Tax=Sneathiella chinensis TaxID=349750 RepID=A0ABQ5U2T2_9PROT|nr:hypothetical protein GCM10007924_16860 [Sneathiella chinensis]